MEKGLKVLIGACVTAAGILGLFLAARAEDVGISLFGLSLFGFAVLLDFWLVKRHFDAAPAAARPHL
jgi:hypothetical protein